MLGMLFGAWQTMFEPNIKYDFLFGWVRLEGSNLLLVVYAYRLGLSPGSPYRAGLAWSP